MARKNRKHWWTVMLLYPDYMSDDYGEDVYVGWARTATPEEAVPVVQHKAAEAQRDLSRASSVDTDPDDFKMIAVWQGRTTLALDAYSAIEEGSIQHEL